MLTGLRVFSRRSFSRRPYTLRIATWCMLLVHVGRDATTASDHAVESWLLVGRSITIKDCLCVYVSQGTYVYIKPASRF